MIRKPITLPQEFKNYIEALYYEKESREKLLLFMFEQDNCNIERFNQIHEEYVDFYAQCDTAKDFLEKEFIRPMGSDPWQMLFLENEVIFYD